MALKKHLKILIVEDHDVASKGIIETLNANAKYTFEIHHALHADKAAELLQFQNFDLVLLDLILKATTPQVQYSSGDELLRHIRKQAHQPKVIVLSKVERIDMLDYILNTLEADGYILKSGHSLQELIPAIETVFYGDQYLSLDVATTFKNYNSTLDLDYRDRITLKKLSEGGTHQDIVDELATKGINVTKSAVEKRIRKLKSRFGADTTAELMVKAMRAGLIS